MRGCTALTVVIAGSLLAPGCASHDSDQVGTPDSLSTVWVAQRWQEQLPLQTPQSIRRKSDSLRDAIFPDSVQKVFGLEPPYTIEGFAPRSDHQSGRIRGARGVELEFWYAPERLYLGCTFPDSEDCEFVQPGSVEHREFVRLLRRIGTWTVPEEYVDPLLAMLDDAASEESRMWLLLKLTETERVGLRCFRLARLLDQDATLLDRQEPTDTRLE
jgi:hypothetical protein